MEKIKKEKKNHKKLIITIVSLLIIIIIALLLWWFNRKFEVSFKYNNKQFEDITIKVKYSKQIGRKYIKKDLTSEGLTFVGWFETLEKNSKSKCDKGFELNDTKTKCISKTEFNFKTKIKKKTTIEALWNNIQFSIDPTEKTINEGESFTITTTISGTNDKTVKFISEDPKIATVTSDGKVTGIKEGKTTIIVESNGIKKKCSVTVNPPKDEGTISLKATDQCMIGSNEVKITATVSNNARDKKINWSTNLKCFNVTKESDTTYKISRNNSCGENEELNPIIKVSLNNGNSDSLKFTYEPRLSYSVYDNNKEIQPKSGIYIGNKITVKTNAKASFTALDSFYGANIIKEKTDKSISTEEYKGGEINITTTCGQKASLTTKEEIN